MISKPDRLDHAILSSIDTLKWSFTLTLAKSVTVIATLLFSTLSQNVFALQENRLVKRIDFRDGSSLEAVIPPGALVWKNIAKDGTVSEKKIPVENIKQVAFVKEPSTARVAKIRNLLSQLGSEDYHLRLEAQIKLSETGKEFEQIIEQYVPDDEETKWRITKVKELLKEVTGPSTAGSTFDVMILNGSNDQLDGELELKDFKVKYGDTEISLSRDNVASISSEPLLANFALSGSAGGGKRQQEYPDASGTMPVGMTFIDFEHLPNGKEMSGNVDVSKAYISKGVVFETSFKDSYVGAQMFAFFNGRGGNYCISNIEPTYEGVITISFCVPGNELFAAGTRYVGFNVAHVNPEGTYFEAYDAQGRLIAKFSTDQTATDFLAFESEVPIAKVIVRPNVEIDEDFAIDDLFFQKPVALLESGNPGFFSVVTRKGERLQASEVDFQQDKLLLKKLSFGAEQVLISPADVWVLIPPRSQQKEFATTPMTNHCYCMKDDGSIVLGNMGNQKSLRFQDKLDLSNLVAVWGMTSQLTTPPTYKVKPGGAAIFVRGQYLDLEGVKLGQDWISSPTLASINDKQDDDSQSTEDVDLTKMKYSNSACIYFGTPKNVGKDVGVVYTYDGERYFIGADYYQVSVENDGVSVSKGGDPILLKWNEISSLRLPKN